MTPIEICRELNIPFRTAAESPDVRDGWLGLNCPYCGRPEDKFYLGWNLRNANRMSCWSCGSVPAVKTLMELTGLPWGRCRELIGDPTPIDWAESDRVALRGKYTEPAGVGDLQFAHISYLTGRGFDAGRLEKLWGLRGIGIAEKLAWRIFIPIHLNSEPVSWTTRAVGDAGPRYVSAKPEQERISPRRILYGGDYVRHAALICEGPADVWAVGPGAVALLGIGYTPAQVLRLARIPNRFVCFDAEPAAQRRATALCRELAGFPGVTQNIVLDAKDPAAAGKRELEALRKVLE